MVLKSMVTHPTHLNKLAVFNNKILRILQCAARDSQYLYTNFNTLTDNLHKFKVLLFVHKFFHHPDQLPPIFVIIFCKKKIQICIPMTLVLKTNYIFSPSPLLWVNDQLNIKVVIYGVHYPISLNQSHLPTPV